MISWLSVYLDLMKFWKFFDTEVEECGCDIDDGITKIVISEKSEVSIFFIYNLVYLEINSCILFFD